MRRLDPVHLSTLLIGVSFACYSPSLNFLQDQAYRSAVVIEGKVQSAPLNASEPYSVSVRVLDVWPRNSGGLERGQLVTVGDFGSETPCAKVRKNHKYIFFMDPADQPLVFKASFAPLDTSGKNLKKDVGRILCEDCAAAPALKLMKNTVLVSEGRRLKVKCEASGNPAPQYKWYKDGSELKKGKEIRIRNGKKNSKVQIGSAKLEDSGNYTCVAENFLGKDNSTSTVHVQSRSGHARRCNDTEKTYCVNGGDCYFIHGINQLSCKCPDGYFGPRCLQKQPMRSVMLRPTEKTEELYQKRVLTITGICVALLVVAILCVVAYCKTKKPRKKVHNHIRQNMCVNPNRTLANGPNHPGPGPEEIPMVDYISKNVPATERVIRQAAEAPFPSSQQSSRSQNSSTHSSTHRHEGRGWSLEHTDSVSGVLSSSVGSSKCSSPACMQARVSRAAHCGFTEPHRLPLQYCDSFHSLGDSPHSDRYVSALTTPARLSPVGFHYSLPPQVPLFQITSPNTRQAASLPPAAHASYPPENHQPPVRRYHAPLREPYRQQQHASYLRDPSSPRRLPQEEEYESTQECLSSTEQPKRSSRHWHGSRLNGHVVPSGDSHSRPSDARTHRFSVCRT